MLPLIRQFGDGGLSLGHTFASCGAAIGHNCCAPAVEAIRYKADAQPTQRAAVIATTMICMLVSPPQWYHYAGCKGRKMSEIAVSRGYVAANPVSVHSRSITQCPPRLKNSARRICSVA